jgi:hypothetical protein
MECLLEMSDLILLNNGKPTRHNPVNGIFSAIDLSIASPSIAPDLEWDTLTSYNGSDHWPILLKLFNLTPKSVPINKWRLKNPNWNLFSTLVDHVLQNSVTDEDTHITRITQNKNDKLTLKLTNSIIGAATVTIGKSNHPTSLKIVPWWNKECKTAIKKYKKSPKSF